MLFKVRVSAFSADTLTLDSIILKKKKSCSFLVKVAGSNIIITLQHQMGHHHYLILRPLMKLPLRHCGAYQHMTYAVESSVATNSLSRLGAKMK